MSVYPVLLLWSAFAPALFLSQKVVGVRKNAIASLWSLLGFNSIGMQTLFFIAIAR